MTPSRARALIALGALLALALAATAVFPAAAQNAPQAPTQAILIETPAPGTLVGSPVVITGSVARLPVSASLNYVVVASDGRVLGSGAFPVPGNPDQAAFFIASLTFQEPPNGDNITLQLIDQDPTTGGVSAVATLPLVTAPLAQRILIDTPAAGTQVGNPLVVTGRTVRFPNSGVLGYAIYDSAGAQVGGGVFPVEGNQLDGGRFAASLSFIYPTFGGPLRVDLYEEDRANGTFPATASMTLQTVALAQQIVVETPPAGTQVGSPVVLTGRTTRFPSAGVLQYSITDRAGVLLGAGSFAVQQAPGQAASFTIALTFQPPSSSGPIYARLADVNTAGQTLAQTVMELRWGP